MNFNRLAIVSLALMLVAGCDDKTDSKGGSSGDQSSAAPAAPVPPPPLAKVDPARVSKLAGTWTATAGDATKDLGTLAMNSKFTLELRADQTFEFKHDAPDLQELGQRRLLTFSGQWTADNVAGSPKCMVEMRVDALIGGVLNPSIKPWKLAVDGNTAKISGYFDGTTFTKKTP